MKKNNYPPKDGWLTFRAKGPKEMTDISKKAFEQMLTERFEVAVFKQFKGRLLVIFRVNPDYKPEKDLAEFQANVHP